MSTEQRHWARGPIGIVAFVVIAAGSFVAAAWLADRLTTQDDEVVATALADPVVVPGPIVTTADDGEPVIETGAIDPGAVEAMADAGAPVEGLSGGAWMLPTELVAADADETGSADDTAPPSALPTPDAPVDAAQAVAMAEQLGTTSVQAPPVTTRFVDLCTDGHPACPFGLAGTVTPLSSDTPPPKLAIKLWPSLTKAAHPELRCDPGYPTLAKLPVVVTANQRLEALYLTLELPDGTVVGQTVLNTPASDVSWTPSGTDLTNSIHYCATFSTLGDPAVAAQLPAGAVVPSPLTYRLRAVAQVPGDSVDAVVDVPADALAPTGARPPTMIYPLSGNVVQIGVPELASSLSGRPTVWVANAAYWQDKVGLGTAASICAKAPPGQPDPGLYDPPKALLVPPAQQYDPGQLAQPTYPFDRSYTQYSVWNAVLAEGSTYALCISLPSPSGEVREAWTLETPNGFQFSFANMLLEAKDSSPYTTWYLRADAAACYVSFPPSVHGGSICPSSGLPYPAITTFTHTATYPAPGLGTGTITDELGSTRVRTPTWCTDVVVDLTAMDLVLGAADSTSVFAQCLGRAASINSSWPVTMRFADQHVLCGSDSCLEEHRHGDVVTMASVGEGNSNERSRNPLDWGIQGPVTPG